MVRLAPTLSPEHRVPVTAKLSKRFYDVLGEDVANELVDWFNAVDLTYRADLRELNELNFARFDAKLEQRLAELRAELREEIAELRAELRQEIGLLRAELRLEFRTELHQVRTELLRWMFGFWVTTLLAMGGLMIALRGH
jgi:hypothetical protein